MTNDADATPPPIDPSAYGRALADAVVAALPVWTEEVFSTRLGAAFNTATPEFSAIVGTLIKAVEGPLTELLTTDIDSQRQSPLALLRALIEPLTAELAERGALAVDRDPYDHEAFPADVYALGPMAWSDFGEEVGDAGLRWGAAKAMAHRQRHAKPSAS